MVQERRACFFRRSMSIKHSFKGDVRNTFRYDKKADYMKYHARIQPVPNFYRQQMLNQHMFKINDVEYEWTRDSYFKKVSIIPHGMVFGEQALIE